MTPTTIVVIILIAVFVAVILILREVTLWYFRINQRFDKLEQIEKNQQETNRLLAEIATQNRAATHPNDLQRSN